MRLGKAGSSFVAAKTFAAMSAWLLWAGAIGVASVMVPFGSNVQLILMLLGLCPAVLLAEVQSKLLIPYIVFVWAVVPGVRRVYDWSQNSYDSVSPLSILPLLTTLTLLLPIAYNRFRLPRTLWLPGAMLGAALIYAFAIGYLRNGAMASLFDLANYLVPLLLICYAGARNPSGEERELWIISFVYIAIAASLYGIFQFLFVPPWDAFWMNNVEMFSNGRPFPLEIRVFSTLNAPEPAAMFFSAALCAMLAHKRWRGLLGWLGVAIVMLGLVITLVRAAWLTTLVALVVYYAFGSARVRWKAALGACVLGIALYAAIPHLPGGEQLLNRFRTMGDLRNDYSFNDRLQFVGRMIPVLLDNPQGFGLGSIGVGTKLENDGKIGEYGNFDNGAIAVLLTYGLAGGALFFAALGGLLWRLRIAIRMEAALSSRAKLGIAILLGAVAYLAFFNRFGGLGGFIVWLFVAAGIEEDRKAGGPAG
ncbi:O-antigen ligase family protein [Paenibacillus thermoaerophilus]|uniref:O-antigen ligase family protein n=1 Tax=Paenibacillus thermoaerophilus TaxID=1215385 RepID=A0ABW2V9F3_9BACL|nr:O-antigen ligase family protein [Paenibacillus thermoaerophilus]TMV16166.1 O-antigen ligase family protein [Paenibacillus thermoaerophilus]